MPTTPRLTEGDHTTFKTTIKNRSTGEVVDYTGGSSRFFWRFDGGRWQQAAATGTPSSGLATYQFSSGLPDHGLMEFYFQVTDFAGKVYSGDIVQRQTVRR